MSLNMISNGNYSIYGGQWMNNKPCKTRPLKLMSDCPSLISISKVRSSLHSHQASGSFSLQGAPFAHLLATSSHRNLTPITPTNLSPKRHSTISPKASKDATQPTLENASNLVATQQYRHLWDQCENCYGLNYKQFLKKKLHVCEHCGHHLKMSSSDRIELLIDPGTWSPLDETMVSVDPIEFDSEDEPYKSRIDSYQRKTGLTEGVQTGTGKLNGIAVAIGVMDFQFMGGSMGSVVGEKLTRLVEHAAKEFLPLIIVCASGGARMQEGSLSLMQMAKISCALHDYQSNKKLFYVPILTSPTTGGVTASFATLGDIIIAEPNAYIAFAGKRVIEQTLNKTLPEGAQGAENLFQKGLFDLIVPRNMLKGVLSELLQLHTFFPFDQN